MQRTETVEFTIESKYPLLTKIKLLFLKRKYKKITCNIMMKWDGKDVKIGVLTIIPKFIVRRKNG